MTSPAELPTGVSEALLFMDAPSRPWPPAKTADRFETTFSYVLPFGRLKEKPDKRMYSPWHVIAGFKWRLLIFPQGNNAYDEEDFEHISVYLDCGGPHTSQSDPAIADVEGDDGDKRDPFWRRPACFTLHLISPSTMLTPVERIGTRRHASGASSASVPVSAASEDHDDQPVTDIVKEASHVFCKGASDWGFSVFAAISSMRRPGRYAEQNGDITLMVTVSFQNSIRRSRSNIADWDSKKETGWVGLKNQGITDYMNVLLQMMYTVDVIRLAVYNTSLKNPDSDNGDESVNRKAQVVNAMKSIFAQLRDSPAAVGTTQLTDAFQWTERDCFYSRDVCDLHDMLIDWFADCRNSTEEVDLFSSVYEGKEAVYFERSSDKNGRLERSFYALSLHVKGRHDLYESFERYTEVRTFEDSDLDDLQERKEWVKFATLPQVLLLQLKRPRGDGDPLKHASDRFEFPKELDLTRFVENSDGSEVYLLHSVVVHDGDFKGGYYSVCIRPEIARVDTNPDEEPQWFEFDDEVVRPCTEEEAVKKNFGGETETDPCAWVLQYIRKTIGQSYPD